MVSRAPNIYLGALALNLPGRWFSLSSLAALLQLWEWATERLFIGILQKAAPHQGALPCSPGLKGLVWEWRWERRSCTAGALIQLPSAPGDCPGQRQGSVRPGLCLGPCCGDAEVKLAATEISSLFSPSQHRPAGTAWLCSCLGTRLFFPVTEISHPADQEHTGCTDFVAHLLSGGSWGRGGDIWLWGEWRGAVVSFQPHRGLGAGLVSSALLFFPPGWF